MRIMRRKGSHEAFTLNRNSYVLVSNPRTPNDFRLKNTGNSQTTFSEFFDIPSVAQASVCTGSG